jgi:hypothetical protein
MLGAWTMILQSERVWQLVYSADSREGWCDMRGCDSDSAVGEGAPCGSPDVWNCPAVAHPWSCSGYYGRRGGAGGLGSHASRRGRQRDGGTVWLAKAKPTASAGVVGARLAARKDMEEAALRRGSWSRSFFFSHEGCHERSRWCSAGFQL